MTTGSITILVDNQAGDGLMAEHGLSLWIKTEGRRILFDAGQGPALESNARALGVDLSTSDTLVVSHGHYDHTGGIPQVLRNAGSARVYCHPGAAQPRYSIRGGAPRSIQMPREAVATLDKLPVQSLHWVLHPVWLSEEIGLTGPIPREIAYEDTGGPFFLDPEGRTPDPIVDDLALWIRTDHGLIICLGCGHAGLVNTVQYVRRLSGESRVHALIGGFHLLNASHQRLDETLTALQSLEPDTVVPCHCTGKQAVELLRQSFGERVLPGMSGTTYRWYRWVGATCEHHAARWPPGGTV